MPLRKKGRYYYGDSVEDIRLELARYSKSNAYLVDHTAVAICSCGGNVFELFTDDDEGVAARVCQTCSTKHLMADGAEYAAEAECEQCICLCEATGFEIMVGVSLYQDSEDVRWLYIGCRCPACGLVGVYADWKNEFIGYRELLANT